MRTIQGRFLLRPSSKANRIIKGTLGRAQRLYGVGVVACVFLSNHFHLLVIPESEKQLADFMRYLNTNLSKELGRLHEWSGALFQRRHQAIPVSEEPEAQVARLRYLLAHGAKEGLVAGPEDWPGVHCVFELERGCAEIQGIWIDRTAIWKARRRGQELSGEETLTHESLTLSSLPAWSDWSREERMKAIAEILDGVGRETRGRHRIAGTRPVGVKVIEAQHPHDRPSWSKKSPAPIAHAATVQVWLAMKIAYRVFLSTYREAADRLRRGLEPHFPLGCFLPTGGYLPRAGPSVA